MKKKIAVMAVLAASAVGLGVYFFLNYRANAIYRDPDFAWGNGRLEATEVNISTKLAGRIEAIYVNDGDFVKKGQLLALMQTNVLKAELEQAEARKNQAVAELSGAEADIRLQQSASDAAEAAVRQKESTLDGARKRFKRAEELRRESAISQQDFEVDETYFQTCREELAAARATLQKSHAAVLGARAAAEAAKANIQAAEADIDRIKADLDDCRLTAPLDGRIQYRIAQAGEVMPAGGKILNLVDLSDVYMTFFLPERAAGKVAVGAQTRLVLDAAPEIPVPASVFFVASVAQFTPKTVETSVERQKLMFRVKARIAPELLRKHLCLVKTGLPGVAWVKLNEKAPWPDFLKSGSGK